MPPHCSAVRSHANHRRSGCFKVRPLAPPPSLQHAITEPAVEDRLHRQFSLCRSVLIGDGHLRSQKCPDVASMSTTPAPCCSTTPSMASPTTNSNQPPSSSSALSASHHQATLAILQLHLIHREHWGDLGGRSDQTDELLYLLTSLVLTAPHRRLPSPTQGRLVSFHPPRCPKMSSLRARVTLAAAPTHLAASSRRNRPALWGQLPCSAVGCQPLSGQPVS
jgi:hypothetical protein